jgi:hypothetical protein
VHQSSPGADKTAAADAVPELDKDFDFGHLSGCFVIVAFYLKRIK